jgi:RNA polymerase sigma-70 factor, ECF subfamily
MLAGPPFSRAGTKGRNMSTDEDLFQQWQRGNADALATLVQRHHAPLVAHLYRLLGDASLAEDLAQETFYRLVRSARSYNPAHPFLPWFYRIARNLASHYRESAYHRLVDLRDDLDEQVTTEADPQTWIERQEEDAALLAALKHLSLEQREVLSLRFGEELGVKETALILDVPVGTVKSRTFSALRRLRACLEPVSLRRVERKA